LPVHSSGDSPERNVRKFDRWGWSANQGAFRPRRQARRMADLNSAS
jgi:hypothetical protein